MTNQTQDNSKIRASWPIWRHQSLRRFGTAFLTVFLEASLLASLAWAPFAYAQTWPERPVKIIAAGNPGTTPHIFSQILADHLARQWGQSVVVEPKSSAGGVVPGQALLQAKPDGYTLMLTINPYLVMGKFLFKSMPFDAQNDFSSVAPVSKGPMMIAVAQESGVKNLAELVAASRAKTGGLSMAVAGNRTLPWMVGRSLDQTTGARMTLIPYLSAARAVPDVISGVADAYIDSTAALLPHVKQGGRLRALAVTSAARTPGFEEVATAREQGFDIDMMGWTAIVAPAGTPRTLLDRINRDINTVLAKPEVIARLRDMGVVAAQGSVADLDNYRQEETAKWERVIKAIGLQPE